MNNSKNINIKIKISVYELNNKIDEKQISEQ